MAGGIRVGKVAAFADNLAIPHYTTQPLTYGSQIPEKSNHQKRKDQAAKDRAFGKRAATEEASQWPKKKKKKMPLSFALSDSEADGSNRSGFCTHHSSSPLNTIILNEAELTTGGDGVVLKSSNRSEEDTGHNLVNVEDTTKVNSSLSEHSLLCSSLRGDGDLLVPFVLAWNLTTDSILNDAESC
ncbi:hypothetical protein Tco_1367080 [Tanacetum coccineum]